MCSLRTHGNSTMFIHYSTVTCLILIEILSRRSFNYQYITVSRKDDIEQRYLLSLIEYTEKACSMNVSLPSLVTCSRKENNVFPFSMRIPYN